jgi:DNA-binding NarL/FixJ family response regulator
MIQPATILLVDDERLVTQGLTAILRTSRYQVFVAQSGLEAIATLRRKVVDVIVVDDCMPGMSGSELLAVVSREFPDTARLMLTGRATVDVAARAINEGKVCRFLQKPCKPAELLTALEEALRVSTMARVSSRLLEVARAEDRRDDSAPVLAERRAASQHAPLGEFTAGQLETLSSREREVLGLVVDGLRLSQVAKALFISPHTAKNHLKAVFGKLGVHAQTELLAKGRGRVR